jgi:hypothetical protein
MPIACESGDSRSIEAGDFRLVFRWLGHSWTHWIEFGGQLRVLALALEGDPDRDHPARVVSPAYQQIHFQAEGSTWQALLVGQSGPHHFSAVFDFEDREPGEVRIGVDIADRCRGPIEALASTYTVDARSDELVDASPSRAAWDFGPGRLTFAATSPAQVALAEAGRRATQIQALAGLDSGLATHRLAYTWHWNPNIRS